MLHCAMCIVQCAPVCPNMHKSGRECHFVPRATACIRASGRGCYVCTTCYSIIELVAACGVTCYSKIELIAACGCDVTCFSTFTVSVRTAGHAWTRVCYVQIYAGEQVRGLYLSSSRRFDSILCLPCSTLFFLTITNSLEENANVFSWLLATFKTGPRRTLADPMCSI